ncbi:catalase-related domain-containing protein [Escherichia coli]
MFWRILFPSASVLAKSDAIRAAHIVDGFSFELSKVVRPYIRERVVDQLAHIDLTLAQAVAKNLGIELTDDHPEYHPTSGRQRSEKGSILKFVRHS